MLASTGPRTRLRIWHACFNAAACRHSVAVEVLRGGASLEQIESLLLHHSKDPGMSYAKVHHPMLPKVAAPGTSATNSN